MKILDSAVSALRRPYCRACEHPPSSIDEASCSSDSIQRLVKFS
jgi:hypothetical protein